MNQRCPYLLGVGLYICLLPFAAMAQQDRIVGRIDGLKVVTLPDSVNGVAAPLDYVSPGQLNIQIPYEVGAGPAVLGVNVNGAVGTGFSRALRQNVRRTPNSLHSERGITVLFGARNPAGWPKVDWLAILP